jgi:hypothetical protein
MNASEPPTMPEHFRGYRIGPSNGEVLLVALGFMILLFTNLANIDRNKDVQAKLDRYQAALDEQAEATARRDRVLFAVARKIGVTREELRQAWRGDDNGLGEEPR